MPETKRQSHRQARLDRITTLMGTYGFIANCSLLDSVPKTSRIGTFFDENISGIAAEIEKKRDFTHTNVFLHNSDPTVDIFAQYGFEKRDTNVYFRTVNRREESANHSFRISTKILRKEDVFMVNRLLHELSPGKTVTVDLKHISKVSKNNLMVFVYDGPNLAAMATIVVVSISDRFPPIGIIEDVVRHPDCRGKDLGRIIMREVLHTAAENGLFRLALTSKPERTTANNLYRELGFVFQPSISQYRSQ